jgi:D-cysteine desulfhydrase
MRNEPETPSPPAVAAGASRPPAGRAPALDGAWLHLFLSPTPVRPLAAAGAGVGHSRLWLKDDAAIDDASSGSKLRKLEPLLGAALAARARSVISFGAEGGGHVLAVARQAQALGLSALLFVTREAAADGSRARANAAALARSTARRVRVPRAVRLAFELGLVAAARGGALGDRYVIAGGGANATGCLGAVAAAIELCGQMVELPDEVWVAAGSGGTAAGLAVGFARLGARTVVRAVDCSSALHPSHRRLARLVRDTESRLRALGRPGASTLPGCWSLIARDRRRAPLAVAAQATATRLEDLQLDEVYTAPAFAAFLERARARPDLRLLFWNTCGRPAPGE